ncbi:MAG: DUF2062 domain-containing protein [Planctomycetaceae bacterium]|nr:DUF2062 domain-containing protein [Planctomycetaceae bacterium]
MKVRQTLKLSSSPRVLLRSVLALDDSPHAIALGTAIGFFVGLTPSVGIQTIMILALVVVLRPVCYFNSTAAMLSTYVSNPLTMVPLYYFWYRLGCCFVPGTATIDQFQALLSFDGLAGWWHATCALGVQVGLPMMIGSLLVAPLGAVVAYPVTRMLVRWVRGTPSSAEHIRRTTAPHTAPVGPAITYDGRRTDTRSSSGGPHAALMEHPAHRRTRSCVN